MTTAYLLPCSLDTGSNHETSCDSNYKHIQNSIQNWLISFSNNFSHPWCPLPVYDLISSFNLNNWSKKLEISLNLVVWFFFWEEPWKGLLSGADCCQELTVIRSWLLSGADCCQELTNLCQLELKSTSVVTSLRFR